MRSPSRRRTMSGRPVCKPTTTTMSSPPPAGRRSPPRSGSARSPPTPTAPATTTCRSSSSATTSESSMDHDRPTWSGPTPGTPPCARRSTPSGPRSMPARSRSHQTRIKPAPPASAIPTPWRRPSPTSLPTSRAWLSGCRAAAPAQAPADRAGGQPFAGRDRLSGALRVPGVAAAVDGRAVSLAPDGVRDPGGTHGDPEVVAVGEGIPGGALIRRAGGAVGQFDLAGPAGPTIGGCGVPGVECAGAVVLPGQPEVTGGWARGNLREVAVTLGVDQARGTPGQPVARGGHIQALGPARDGAERVGHHDVPGGIGRHRRGRIVVVGVALEHRARRWGRAGSESCQGVGAAGSAGGSGAPEHTNNAGPVHVTAVGRGSRPARLTVLAEVHGPVRADGPAVGVPPQVVLTVDLLRRQERARIPELVGGHDIAVQLAVERDVHILAGGRDDQHGLVHVPQRPVHRDRAL